MSEAEETETYELDKNVIEITIENFKEEVIESDIPVLLEFWNGWCIPCFHMRPVISKLADEYVGKIKVGTVNADRQAGIAAGFYATNVPSMFLLIDGKVMKKTEGYQSPESVIENLGLDNL